ncbi:MAG: polysaccharide biosynthesis/export family protein [Paramuribaculum sp.]|nr:polysaccharide biosynthesis/export family protein [Paramuribaculum sp.]
MKTYIRLLSVFIAAAALTSCRTTTSLSYMQSLGDSKEGTLPSSTYGIKISPEDELRIIVTSSVPEATAEYNLPAYNVLQSGDETSATYRRTQTEGQQQQLYTVDRSGDIFFPKLGKIHVAGMTTSQLQQYICDRVTVKDPHVSVKLMNFRVDVMGEVQSPKRIDVQSERFSIFDALSAAGDMTPYARRDNVTVIREDGDSLRYSRLDLRDASVTASPYYYLRPNDVVIVDSNEIRHANAKYNQNNAYKLSVISTIVSGVSVIASLLIALVLK